MNEQQQSEIRELTRMFETPGWIIFSQIQREQAQNLRLNGWNSIKTTEELHYMRGFLTALEGIAEYDRVVAAQEQQLTAIDAENPV